MTSGPALGAEESFNAINNIVMLNEFAPVQLFQTLLYFLSKPLVVIEIALHEFLYEFLCITSAAGRKIVQLGF